MISVRAKGDISNSNNNLMLGDCIGERLTLEFALRYWSCKLVIIPSFDCKIPWKKCRHIYSAFGSTLVLLQVGDCKGRLYLDKTIHSNSAVQHA